MSSMFVADFCNQRVYSGVILQNSKGFVFQLDHKDHFKPAPIKIKHQTVFDVIDRWSFSQVE